MSFLSRKPSRPGSRDGGAGREEEYDDYDLYAPDGYHSEDESWSPGEYFSPEGIKGKWAGEHPEGRSGGRGQREDQPGEFPRDDGFSGRGPDELVSGGYELPAGADADPPERSRRRRKDRDDRTSWTGSLRLRRDRGEDIWPDDGISDEDYWASVASDSPLVEPPPGGAVSRPRPGAGQGGSPGGAESRGQAQRREEQRGAPGRLGPPPGLPGERAPGGTDRPGSSAAPGRPGTGSAPTVGITASRPPAASGPGAARNSGPQPGWPGPAPGGFPPAAAQPSFQPSGPQAAVPAGGERQRDRGDWGERTERIERVNASGYPEPRPAGRSQARPDPAPGAGPGFAGGTGRRAPDGREAGRERDPGSIWSSPARDEDPLTSTAFSRQTTTDDDGRSYRTAARRSQAQVQLTDQTEVFALGQYQSERSGGYPAAPHRQPPSYTPAEQRTGEYPPYRGDAAAAGAGRPPAYGASPAAQAPADRSGGFARQPSRGRHAGGSQPEGAGPLTTGQPTAGQPALGRPGYDQSGRPPGRGQGQAGPPPGYRPGSTSRPGPAGNGFPGGQPRAGLPSGGYAPSPQSAPAAPQPGSQQSAAPRPQPQAPPAGPLSAPVPAGPEGRNPYNAGGGAHPYAGGQPYPGRPAAAAPDDAEDGYYRPPAPGGYPDSQDRPGYGNSPRPRGDRPY
jgi:hypothetical protein